MRRFLSRLIDAVRDTAPSLTVVVIAVVCGAATTILLVATGLLTTAFSVPVPLLTVSAPAPVVTFLLVVLLILILAAVLPQDSATATSALRTVPLWGRAAVVGFVCALALTAVLVVGLSASPIPLGPVVFLSGWALWATGLVLQERRSTRNGGSRLRATLVGVGYAQLRGVERRTLAVFVGGIGAVATSALTTFLSQYAIGRASLPVVVAVSLLVWVAGTILTYDRYTAATERSNLTVLEIRQPGETHREMELRNDSDRVIDLSDGSVQDTEHARYRVTDDRRLGPGETCTLAVPEAFSLAPAEATVDLPLGYTLERGSDFPILTGRTGQRFRLRPDAGASSTGRTGRPEGVDGG